MAVPTLLGQPFFLMVRLSNLVGEGMTRLATSQPLVASLNAHLGRALNGVHKAE